MDDVAVAIRPGMTTACMRKFHNRRMALSFLDRYKSRATYSLRSREANTLNEIMTDSHSLFDFEFAGADRCNLGNVFRDTLERQKKTIVDRANSRWTMKRRRRKREWLPSLVLRRSRLDRNRILTAETSKSARGRDQRPTWSKERRERLLLIPCIISSLRHVEWISKTLEPTSIGSVERERGTSHDDALFPNIDHLIHPDERTFNAGARLNVSQTFTEKLPLAQDVVVTSLRAEFTPLFATIRAYNYEGTSSHPRMHGLMTRASGVSAGSTRRSAQSGAGNKMPGVLWLFENRQKLPVENAR
ncbi:hypothetical protein EAG_10334 [Camponotus floridanus]|uniref:Uncharacterized protein n=1 Tax=Camponotus floridanus TaxID=104421 RepID=E2AM26_CAMFO|nr:hypothetical protein EAG_10334 [Camponotus floridanus]